jgi:deoxyribodipyrimidine photolyase-related protein
MQEVTIIFPDQLFKTHPSVNKSRIIYLLEEFLYLKKYNFHQQKLIAHRAIIKFYKNYLASLNKK